MTGDGGEMWLSTREIRRAGDPEWDDFIRCVGLPHLREVRTIDSWCNPCVDGNYPVSTLDELWERLEMGLLPAPAPGREYYLLFTDALGPNGSIAHPRLRPLGYDLSDETWTSSLLNCGRWQGVLEPIARRTGANGLLSLADAQLARALLPEAWGGDPHGFVTVWALFEVTPGEAADAEPGAAPDRGRT
ncbi:MAG TPA: hypothetical protein VJ739_19555 [Gemmataceae bacterium]|nr:hypothetical protein [Gemmataceae bacterium]